MGWLIYQTWLLLLIAFLLGCLTAWLVARYLPTPQPTDEADTPAAQPPPTEAVR